MEPNPRSVAPVVVTAREDLAPIVEAGAARSGGAPVTLVVPVADESTLTAAMRDGAEIVVAVRRGAGAIDSLISAISLGGHGIAVIEVEGVEGGSVIAAPTIALLSNPSLPGVNVAVPTIEEDLARAALWASLRAQRFEERHQLVEVDGHPALDEMADRGLAAGGDGIQLLAAGAAGVLAGRIAAAARRWRPE